MQEASIQVSDDEGLILGHAAQFCTAVFESSSIWIHGQPLLMLRVFFLLSFAVVDSDRQLNIKKVLVSGGSLDHRVAPQTLNEGVGEKIAILALDEAGRVSASAHQEQLKSPNHIAVVCKLFCCRVTPVCLGVLLAFLQRLSATVQVGVRTAGLCVGHRPQQEQHDVCHPGRRGLHWCLGWRIQEV